MLIGLRLPDGKFIIKDKNLYQGNNVQQIITSSNLPSQFIYIKLTDTINKTVTKSGKNSVIVNTTLIDFAQRKITPYCISIVFQTASFSLTTSDQVNYLHIGMDCESVQSTEISIDNEKTYTTTFPKPYGSILNSTWFSMGINYATYNVYEMPSSITLSCTYRHGIAGRDYTLQGKFVIKAQYTIYVIGQQQ